MIVLGNRTGKVAHLTVRTQDEEDSVATGESPGTYSVLELNPATAKFYIGGVPDSAGVSTIRILYLCRLSIDLSVPLHFLLPSHLVFGKLER